MNAVKQVNEILQEGTTSPEVALNLFDQLDEVTIEFMFGQWKGSGFDTNHPMDGMLEAFNWYGKEFIDADNVHPLLFLDEKNNIFKVNPSMLPLELITSISLPKNQIMKRLFLSMKPLLKTKQTQARIKMMEYEGKVSATMIYDKLPIHDVFRKVDDDTVLGLMDLKKMEQPFFFILERIKDQ